MSDDFTSGAIELIESSDEYDPRDYYPPMDEENACLGLSLDGDCNFAILGHTGRFFHAQCEDAGFNGEEVGIDFPDWIGYFVLDGGTTWESRDWESGHVDDYGCSGNVRHATAEDFVRFDVELPEMLRLDSTLDTAMRLLRDTTSLHISREMNQADHDVLRMAKTWGKTDA